MKRKHWILVFLIPALLLSACNGESQATEQVSSGPKTCLEGTWELTDAEAFARAVLPPGSFDPDSLNYRGFDGALAYSFSNDGFVAVQALGWVARFIVSTAQGSMGLELVIDGLATGEYSQDNDRLIVGESVYDGINYKAFLDHEMMQDSNKASDFAPLFVDPFKSAKITCDTNSLALEILNRPTLKSPITFKRVELIGNE